MPSRNYRDLIAWQKGMDYAEAIYRAARLLPKDEAFGLSLQLRRAAVSIPSNMAEGQGRGTDPELVRYFRISLGSLRETETQVMLAGRLGLLDQKTTENLLQMAAEVSRLIHGLLKSKQ